MTRGRRKPESGSETTTVERVQSDLRTLAGQFDRKAMFNYIGDIRAVLDGAERFLNDGHTVQQEATEIASTVQRQPRTRTRRVAPASQSAVTDSAQQPAAEPEQVDAATAEGD